MGRLKIVSIIFLLIGLIIVGMFFISPIFKLFTFLGLMLYALIIYFVYLIWAIVDIVKADKSSNWKLTWILIVLFLGPIGIIIYFLFGRKQKEEESWEERIERKIEAIKGKRFK